MKIVTAAEIRQIEASYMEKSWLPPLVLMETAARGAANHVLARFPKGRVAVLCGAGVNGGDGLAAARFLAADGLEVEVYLAGNPQNAPEVVKTAIRALNACGIVPRRIASVEDAAVLPPAFARADCIIDALLGTGVTGDVRAPLSSVIEAVNASCRFVFSIDMPSGICADTGRVCGIAVRAAQTLAIGTYKRGLLLYPGAEYVGELLLDGIGLPRAVFDNITTEMLTADEICALLPARPARSHKYTFGRVLSAAGCDQMPGAAVMAATAAYRAGAGLVTAAGTAHVIHTIHNWLKEAVTLILPDENGALCAESASALSGVAANVLLLGPGLSDCPATEEFVGAMLRYAAVPTVVDADALNIAARHKDWLCEASGKAPVLLTPHMGEMSRLTGLPADALLADTIGAAAALAQETGAIVLLKDAHTIVAAPDGRVTINPTGCNAMATAGSGDVLAGLIAGLAAQGADLHNAARVGCYLHGLAGELAAAEKSAYSVIASDILDYIPAAFRQVGA